MLRTLRFRISSLSSSSQSNRKFCEKKDNNAPQTLPAQVPVPKTKLDSSGVTQDDLKWRTPWHQKEAKNYSLLRTFYSEKSKASTLKRLQTQIDFTPAKIKEWWAKKLEERDILYQEYLPERHKILGNELATAHFLVYRGGAVKFWGQDVWIKADEHGRCSSLPHMFEVDKKLQAIDCSDMNLYYEGLFNLQNLENVEWISFNGCPIIDDWCLDKITNIFSHSAIYLDLRDCPNISERGIGAVYKMRNLKILLLDDFLRNTRYEMTCLLLQEANPNLDIKGKEY